LSDEIAPNTAPLPAGQGEEAKADLHKPKRWHRLREFLKEYLIIVIGVLTALGAGQIADAVHKGADVREARQALHEEIMADLATVAWGLEEDKCLLAQLPAYAAWTRGGPKPSAFRTILPGFGTSTWDTVKASAVPNMPLQERLAVAAFYDELKNEQGVIDIQRSNALVLVGAHERRALSQADAGRVLDAIAVEREITNFHVLNGTSLMRGAAEMGLKPPPLPASVRNRIAQLCGQAGPSAVPREP
jgi:hypothetical protein